MKNKKQIKKISKNILKEINKSYILKKKRSTQDNYSNLPVNSAADPAYGGTDFTIGEYNKEVSLKFKKLFNNIIKYPDNIRVNYTLDTITIDVANSKLLKKQHQNTNTGTFAATGLESVNIYILKGGFFSITQGYSKFSKYVDVDMYNDLIEITKNTMIQSNIDNFDSIYDSISIESGIIRDSNLDEILN